MMIGLLVLTALVGCAPDVVAPVEAPPDPRAKNVLVVVNEASPDAIEIAKYYVEKRKIPASNVVNVRTGLTIRYPEAEIQKQVFEPVRKKIASLKTRIDFIVTTKGMPLAFAEQGHWYSLDAHLMAMNLKWEPLPQQFKQSDIVRALNPYCLKNESFDSSKYGFYLVTRLDGPSVAACKKLVDNALAARPESGPFLIDGDPTKPDETYSLLPGAMQKARDILDAKKFRVNDDNTRVFMSSVEPVMGYVTWGSNDPSFDARIYKGIRFKPGAICETFVSTSGRSFIPESTGQSMITDLIGAGVTGVKGYVSEPYTIALARPDILFDRYTSGFNLAESFYMASPLLKWKDVVIGDPLCNPYRKR